MRGTRFPIRDHGNEAATWHFAGLIEHWNKKHAKAAYVPYKARAELDREYFYGSTVRLAEETDFLRFLKTWPTVKRRSQFRIKSQDISALYARTETVNVVTQ